MNPTIDLDDKIRDLLDQLDRATPGPPAFAELRHYGRSAPSRVVPLTAAAALVAIGVGGLVAVNARNDNAVTQPAPPTASQPAPSIAPVSTAPDVGGAIPPATAPFVGVWESTSTEGSSQTMDIIYSGTEEYEVVVRDVTAACSSGAPATMTGVALLEADERLVIAQPELICSDDTIPRIGTPPQAELANFTFDVDTATDELVDSSGVVWRRPWLRQGTTPTVGAVAEFPDLTTTFVSPRNGLSMKHPDGVALTPAETIWNPELTNVGVDVVDTGAAAVFKGASMANDAGSPTIEGWFDYLPPASCGVPLRQLGEITIDGIAGRISECPNEIVASVYTGGRFYLFTLLHDRNDARAVFDAFVATIELTPQTAYDVPGMTRTFVSPINGYSFNYLDRGGLEPAKELWDPANTPPADQGDQSSDDAFDLVETGMGAFFKSASTEIPGGVSIDEWVDDYVSPRDCWRPRSEQEEIIIDGQSGRISECSNGTASGVGGIHATVVAGGRLYLFTLLHTRADARAFFDDFVAKIDLTPETAAVR